MRTSVAYVALSVPLSKEIICPSYELTTRMALSRAHTSAKAIDHVTVKESRIKHPVSRGTARPMHLRSASSPLLIVRRTRLSTIGDRAFPVAAARVWNGLPRHVGTISGCLPQSPQVASSGAAFHNPIPLLCLRSDTRHCRTH